MPVLKGNKLNLFNSSSKDDSSLNMFVCMEFFLFLNKSLHFHLKHLFVIRTLYRTYQELMSFGIQLRGHYIS